MNDWAMGKWLLRIALLAVLAATAGCTDVDRYPTAPFDLRYPATITDAQLTYDPVNGQVLLTWTVPRVSKDASAIKRYDIRYQYDSDLDWDTASPVPDPPQPGPTGTNQWYLFRQPELGGRLCVAIQTIDDAENISEPSNPIFLQVPGVEFEAQIVDVYTKLPLEGIEVVLDGMQGRWVFTTDAQGRFAIGDLRPQQLTVSIATDPDDPEYYDIEHSSFVSEDTEALYHLIPFQASELYPSFSILAFFNTAFQSSIDANQLLRKWRTAPVYVYVPEFVNSDGIDYRQVAMGALNRWMEVTGLPLFQFVDSMPSTGITLDYKPIEEMGIHLAFVEHENTPDGFPLMDTVNVIDNFRGNAVLHKVFMHELGHTIRISHLPPGFLMYAGQPIPDDPTNDEIRMVKMLHALPILTDMSIYKDVAP